MGVAKQCNFCKDAGLALGVCKNEVSHKCDISKIPFKDEHFFECQCCSDFRADSSLWERKTQFDLLRATHANNSADQSRPRKGKRNGRNVINEEPAQSSDPRDHKCLIKGKRSEKIWERYGAKHPLDWNDPLDGNRPARCDACKDSPNEICDVDPWLNMGCSKCTGSCLFHGRPLRHRPNVYKNISKWFRHACECCKARREKASSNNNKNTYDDDDDADPDSKPCTWLIDRSSWNRACKQCSRHERICADGGILKYKPPGNPIPQRKDGRKTWEVRSAKDLGEVELADNTPFRKPCKRCKADGAKCLVFYSHPDSSCNRCWQFGVDCVTTDGKIMVTGPISQVGHGYNAPFRSCRQCQRTGKNCDRQRPCDSCAGSDKEHLCDPWVARSEKESKSCLNGRLDPRPGPLYYLAMGYGAEGVDDDKDGSKLEHWIGPNMALYGHAVPEGFRAGQATGWEGLHSIAQGARNKYMPEGVPPSGFDMGRRLPSELTVEDIRGAMRGRWEGAYVPGSSSRWVVLREQSEGKVGMLPKGVRPRDVTDEEEEMLRLALEERRGRERAEKDSVVVVNEEEEGDNSFQPFIIRDDESLPCYDHGYDEIETSTEPHNSNPVMTDDDNKIMSQQQNSSSLTHETLSSMATGLTPITGTSPDEIIPTLSKFWNPSNHYFRGNEYSDIYYSTEEVEGMEIDVQETCRPSEQYEEEVSFSEQGEDISCLQELAILLEPLQQFNSRGMKRSVCEEEDGGDGSGKRRRMV